MLIAIPIALFPVGRFFFSAILGGLFYHLLLLSLYKARHRGVTQA